MNPATASTPVKTALVTGAGRRIGRAIALKLAAEGWDIALHYRHSSLDAAQTAADIRDLGRRAVLLDADLADEAAVRALLPRAIDALGPVSCVVNNASLFDYDSPADFSPALLATHMQANVAAPLLLAQALHAATPAGSQAVVINLLDQKLANLNPDYLSYTLSKAALQAATTMLSGPQSEAGFTAAHQATPLGRSSEPDDIAAAVCYLAGARAVTGAILLVDGGQHLLPLPRDVMFLTK